MRLVADDLAAATGPRVVVLVTNSEEHAAATRSRLIRDLHAQGYDVRVNIVGFDVANPALQATFQQWANLGGGLFFDAANADELGSAVAQAVRPIYRIVNGAGNVVATGVVGGEPVGRAGGRLHRRSRCSATSTLRASHRRRWRDG